MPAHPADGPDRFRWIVDGHNAIFAIPEWEALQLSGEKREARVRLEETIESFGRAIGSQIWVVYDGNDLDRNPDAVVREHVRSFYSFPPEEADDRVRFLAAGCIRSGERPAVVTSDRRTLIQSLPPGVRSVDVRAFFSGVVRKALQRPEKWEPARLEDVERFFLSQSPFASDRRSVDGESAGDPRGDDDDPAAS